MVIDTTLRRGLAKAAPDDDIIALVDSLPHPRHNMNNGLAVGRLDGPEHVNHQERRSCDCGLVS